MGYSQPPTTLASTLIYIYEVAQSTKRLCGSCALAVARLQHIMLVACIATPIETPLFIASEAWRFCGLENLPECRFSPLPFLGPMIRMAGKKSMSLLVLSRSVSSAAPLSQQQLHTRHVVSTWY